MLFQNRKHVIIFRCVIGALFLVLLILAIVEIASGPGKKSGAGKDTALAQGSNTAAGLAGSASANDPGTIAPTEPPTLPPSVTKEGDSKLDVPATPASPAQDIKPASGSVPSEPPPLASPGVASTASMPFKESLKTQSVTELMKTLDALRAKKTELDLNEKDTLEMIKTRLKEQKQAVSELEKMLEKIGVDGEKPKENQP